MGSAIVRSAALTAMGDRRLVELVLAGGPLADAALSALLARHREWVRRACMRRLRHAQDAEDAAQEVLLKACQGLAGYEGRATVKTWLGAIVERECINLARSRSRDIALQHLRSLIELYEFQNRSEARDPGARLGSVLEALPQRARHVIELRYFADLKLEEIALLLDISLSATKMRLYRALDQLRERYLASVPGLAV